MLLSLFVFCFVEECLAMSSFGWIFSGFLCFYLSYTVFYLFYGLFHMKILCSFCTNLARLWRLNDINIFQKKKKNIAEGYGNLNGVDVVKMWASEKPFYSHDTNSCVGDECLHYTQVVWRKSVHLGCGRAKCKNGWWFVTCNYDPVGNFEGQSPYWIMLLGVLASSQPHKNKIYN